MRAHVSPTVLRVDDLAAGQRAVRLAARTIERNAVVAFPTETVYGLGANAESVNALGRLASLKGRPSDKPFALLVASPDAIGQHAHESPMAKRLAQTFWPGPLTLVLPALRGGAIGLRMPDHPLSLALLRETRVGVAATSANRSGEPAAADAAEVVALFGGAVDLVLDDGTRPAGTASTVIRVMEDRWRLLREGALPAEDVRALVGPETP